MFTKFFFFLKKQFLEEKNYKKIASWRISATHIRLICICSLKLISIRIRIHIRIHKWKILNRATRIRLVAGQTRLVHSCERNLTKMALIGVIGGISKKKVICCLYPFLFLVKGLLSISYLCIVSCFFSSL